MDNYNKVEAYLNNDLNGSEKEDFLRELESNTELKSEYNFQNEIINGIKEARKAELKAMLNNVPVSAVGTVSTGLYKMVLAGVASIIIGSGLWYFYTTTDNKKAPTNLTNTEIIASNKTTHDLVISTSEKNLNEEKITTSPSNHKKEQSKAVAKNTPEQRTPQIITPTVPSTESEMSNNDLPQEDLDIPDNLDKTSLHINSKVDVEIVLKKKYDFHYTFANSKLVLYGKFEEGLFEVLELNKSGETEVYLYFKSNFYYINNTLEAIVPLKAVSNKPLLDKLKRLRQK